MTTRTPEATVRWAIATLDVDPHHQGAQALLQRVPASSPLHASALGALERAERERRERPTRDEPATNDWPPGMTGE